jgi:hypothetical protein
MRRQSVERIELDMAISYLWTEVEVEAGSRQGIEALFVGRRVSARASDQGAGKGMVWRAWAYVVSTTSKEETSANVSRLSSSRSSRSDVCSRTTRSEGAHLRNSASHGASTESGQMTRCGPGARRVSVRMPKKAMACTVLPKPISSASTQLMPWRYVDSSQLTPSTWWATGEHQTVSNHHSIRAYGELGLGLR